MDALQVLARTLDGAVDSVMVVDTQLVITYINPPAARPFGREPEGLVGKKWEAFLPSDELTPWVDQVRQVFDSGMPLRAESEYGSGEALRVFEYAISPARAPDGKVTHVAFVGRDVTERRIAQRNAAQLQLLTHRLASTLTQAEVGELMVGQVHEYLAATSSIAYFLTAFDSRLKLVASRNVRPQTVRDLPVLDPAATLPAAAAVRERRAIWVESPQALREQFPRLLELEPASKLESICAVPLIFDDEVVGTIALSFSEPTRFPDSTRSFLETLAAECAQALVRARLIERERRARDHATFLSEATTGLAQSLEVEEVLEKLAQLVVPRFADWCTIAVPEGASYRYVGVAHADPSRMQVAREIQRRYPPDPSRPGAVQQVMRTREPLLIPRISDELLAAATSDPEHLRMISELGMRSTLLVPIVRADQVYGVISLIWGDSGRTYDASDLLLVRELAARAALALENARLYREVTSAVELREDFLAMAGHELRTPLSALLLQIQSLDRAAEKDPALAPYAEKLERAAGSGLRLSKLVSQLLDVTRISSDRLVLSFSPTDLGALVREVADHFTDAARTAGSPIRIHVPAPVLGDWDKDRLDQVVTNLISNAIKYGGGRPIDVSVGREGEVATLEVKDTGIGIGKEKVARLFQRFERAVTSSEYGGLGLGLWISRQIVEGHRGTIEVESIPGDGARFIVRLPLQSPPQETLPA